MSLPYSYSTLDESEDDLNEKGRPGHRGRFVQRFRRYGLHMLLICLNVIWSIILVLYAHRSWALSSTAFEVPSPALDAIPIERVKMNSTLWLDNEFKGDPDEVQTAAWAQFFPLLQVAVSGDDLEAIGKDSVKLDDGEDRYLAMLDVFHQLHCLDKIRLYIHRDYYQSHEHPQMQLIHVHHCLDNLRQIVMCHGDTELLTFQYSEDPRRPNPMPEPNFIVERKCRKWDDLVDWTRRNAASLEDAESKEEWERRVGIKLT